MMNLTASIFRERPWFANSSGIMVENKAKIGSTVPDKLKMDTFQPLGRASSRTRVNQSNERETATTYAHEDHMMKTEKEYSS